MPPLHYQTAIEPPMNGGESSLDGICSIGKQQVFQFKSNYGIKKKKKKKGASNKTVIINKDTLTKGKQVSVTRYQYKGKQVSVTKIPKIKQYLFPKEVGLKSNKNHSKRSLDIHKDKGLLRVLLGRPSVKPE